LLANSAVVHADETSWSINSVWAFLSEKARLLFFGVHKDAVTLEVILDPQSFQGIVVSDDAAVYANFSQSQKCWAHPIYAGAYAYGLHRAGIRNPATGRTEGGQWFVPPEELPVLIHGRLPAYISWDQFLKNQEQLKQNRSLHHTRGAPKRGEALTGTKFSVCAAAFLPRKNASTAACPPNSSTTGPKNIAVAHSAAIRTGVSWLSNQW
jgi:hypothetical protein